MGRARELAVVRAFVYQLSAQGATLRLVGEPGVGKPALLTFMGRRAHARVTGVSAGHLSLITKAADVARVIVTAARATS